MKILVSSLVIVKLQSSRRLVSSPKGEVFQGEFCEENVRISDALFPGQHSWMSVDLVTAVRSDTIPTRGSPTLTLSKLSYYSHLSPGISLISDLVHDSGMLQSELFTCRSQNLVLAKLPNSGFWRYGQFFK